MFLEKRKVFRKMKCFHENEMFLEKRKVFMKMKCFHEKEMFIYSSNKIRKY